MRRTRTLALPWVPLFGVCALVLAGCHGWWGRKPAPAPRSAALEPLKGTPGPGAVALATTTSQPTSAATAAQMVPTAVMATVNGRPIYMEEVLAPLLEAHGLRTAEMLVMNLLVAQEAARLNVVIAEEEVAAEQERALREIFGEQVTPQQRQQVLNELLLRRGLTRPQWDATMRRNAILRKMAAPRVSVTEPMIQAEYARQFGENVQISHIQLPSVAEAEKIIQMLNEGQDFAALARKYSTNANTAKDGGILPPFARENASVPKAMRDAAFALQRQGQLSGIVQVGNEFHVLRLDKRFLPPQADYEKVKEQLRQQLAQALLERVQQEMLAELRRQGDVEYVNPVLRKAAATPTPGP